MNKRIEKLTTEEMIQVQLALKTLIKRCAITNEPKYMGIYDIIADISDKLQQRGITHIV
jgi:hypothetical protein